ncbi:phosphatidylinositol-specific phospholipase C [Kitasatospora sp. NPDC056531]|uniref:phosphatidylinositol-specific phospholipase C n=1 Tax=Kitasatospora sp. NPDC056531 TaxID=3345856 RepID=UPI0036D11D31
MTVNPNRRDILRLGGAVGGGALTAALGLTIAATPAAAASWNSGAWMAGLPDSLSLTQLTIPGTHDSCCVDPTNGTEWAHTQNWGVTQQLQRGIRFLDIRLQRFPLNDRETKNWLGVFHDRFPQGSTLRTVLDECRAFFKQSPREALVMRIKNENAGSNPIDGVEFLRRMQYHLDGFGYRNLFWTAPRWPRLGEARGKIVLLADFDTSSDSSWDVMHWGNSDLMNIQDQYQDVGTDGKARAIVNQFDQAWWNQNSPKMYINFTSYAGGKWPKLNADSIMPPVLDYLYARRNEAVHFGIVPMDFPDFHTNVLDLLVAKNFIGR